MLPLPTRSDNDVLQQAVTFVASHVKGVDTWPNRKTVMLPGWATTLKISHRKGGERVIRVRRDTKLIGMLVYQNDARRPTIRQT